MAVDMTKAYAAGYDQSCQRFQPTSAWDLVLSAWSDSKRVLVLAVGGGNDSVSALLIVKSIADAAGEKPFDIACMLPDVLEYGGVEQSASDPCLVEVGPDSERFSGGKAIGKFVEARLARDKDRAGLPLEKIWGFRLSGGSRGVASALSALVESRGYGLVLAVDVGGDFVAVEENKEVLSPMMDGIMLAALRSLRGSGGLGVPVFGALMGLGTDGESSPQMLDLAMGRLYAQERSFDAGALGKQIAFYRECVEPLRYSRTADFAIREMEGAGHENPAVYRGRFHALAAGGEGQAGKVFYGNFMRAFDESRYGKFYVYGGVEAVQNPFALDCASTLEWFMKVQSEDEKLNCEMNGQTLPDLGSVLGDARYAGESMYFATPSRLFGEKDSLEISALGAGALKDGACCWMVMWQGAWEALPAEEKAGLSACGLGKGMVLACKANVGTRLQELAEKLSALRGSGS